MQPQGLHLIPKSSRNSCETYCGPTALNCSHNMITLLLLLTEYLIIKDSLIPNVPYSQHPGRRICA